MKANILGTEYQITIANLETDPKLEQVDGYCDGSTKSIVVDELNPDVMSKGDLKSVNNRILRHEIIHAFLLESGLESNSNWAENEEMIDWFAIQFPKMKIVFEGLKII